MVNLSRRILGRGLALAASVAPLDGATRSASAAPPMPASTPLARIRIGRFTSGSPERPAAARQDRSSTRRGPIAADRAANSIAPATRPCCRP